MASSTSSNASSMAELMAKSQSKVIGFKKGDTIQGTVKKLTKHEITVDIGGKTDAVVLEKEKRLMNNLLATLKVGEKVAVSILNPESDLGMPVVSLRRFMEDASWKILEELKKDQKQIEVTVTDVTKGGFVVATESGVSGFLPQSHVSLSQSQQIGEGTKLKVVILELNRPEHKVILSQKNTLSDSEFADVAKQLKPGTTMNVTVVNITPFGLFVTVPVTGGGKKTIDGLIHISELSWEKVTDIGDTYTAGQEIQAVLIGTDRDAKRVDLSIKRLTTDPFAKVKEKYPVDKKVSGTVSLSDNTGVHVDLGDGVMGLIKKDKVPPTMTFETGKTVNVTVSEHDSRHRRLLLTPVLLEKPLGYR